MVKTRKLKYFGHISRHASIEKNIMLGTMPGLRGQGGQRKQWKTTSQNVKQINTGPSLDGTRQVGISKDRL